MRARRTVAAVLVAGLSAAAALAGSAPAASAATPAATVVVAPDGGGILQSGHDLGFTVTITNTGGAALADGRVTASLDPAPVPSTAALLDSIAKPPEALQGYSTKTTGSVSALAVGSTGSLHLTVTAADLAGILTSASGARRLYVQYAPRGAAAVIADTAVTQMAAGAPSIGFSAIIPITAPAGTTGIVDGTKQAHLAAPDGAWTRALHAAQADPTVAVALDPAVIASIRLAGSSAPPAAQDLLTRLASLPNEFLRLPYADTDLTLARAAGVRSSLDPTSFAGATFAAPTTGPTPAPTATATAGSSTTSVTALTDWNWASGTLAWPVPHTTGSADLAAFAAAKDRVLLASDDIQDTPARLQAGPLARVDGAQALVSDATVSSLLAAASAGTTGGAAALANLTGVLATAAVSRQTTGFLATVGRSGDTTGLERALRLLGGQGWVRNVAVADLGAASTAAQVRLQPHAVPVAQASAAKALIAGEQQVHALGSAVLGSADVVTAPPHLALLGALSTAWRTDPAGWATASETVEQGFADVVAKVSIPPSAASNAIGTDGHLAVVIKNDLPVPVKVVVKPSVSNGRLQFPGSSGVAVTVPAEASSSGRLAFRSITNGSTDVTLTLETPSGDPIGRSVVRAVTVRAGFDTIVAVVLLTALGLLLALGVYRNVKRRRQPRQTAAA